MADPHAHTWIDPEEPPIERAPYSPAIGPLRREMKPGKTYVCRDCGLVITISKLIVVRTYA